MVKRSNFEWNLYESKMLWKGILNLDICSPWSEALFMLNRMKMTISDSDQSHSSNGLFFSLKCKQPLRHTALLIKCNFELWSITCTRLPITTAWVNSNMTKTALLVKSDFELWSFTCIKHELWSLTSFAHGQFNLFAATFNWIYILSQWLDPFNRSLFWLLFSTSILPSFYWRISIGCFYLWIGSSNIVQLLTLFIRKNVFWS